MYRNFFTALLLILFLSLSGCLSFEPVRKTEYEYIPPRDALGRMCVNNCLLLKSTCENNCEARSRENRRFDSLERENRYLREQTNMGWMERDRYFYSPSNNGWESGYYDHEKCLNNCGEQYNFCYRNCGGEIIIINGYSNTGARNNLSLF